MPTGTAKTFRASLPTICQLCCLSRSSKEQASVSGVCDPSLPTLTDTVHKIASITHLSEQQLEIVKVHDLNGLLVLQGVARRPEDPCN